MCTVTATSWHTCRHGHEHGHTHRYAGSLFYFVAHLTMVMVQPIDLMTRVQRPCDAVGSSQVSKKQLNNNESKNVNLGINDNLTN